MFPQDALLTQHVISSLEPRAWSQVSVLQTIAAALVLRTLVSAGHSKVEQLALGMQQVDMSVEPEVGLQLFLSQ
jgi:hypothetical protein